MSRFIITFLSAAVFVLLAPLFLFKLFVLVVGLIGLYFACRINWLVGVVGFLMYIFVPPVMCCFGIAGIAGALPGQYRDDRK